MTLSQDLLLFYPLKHEAYWNPAFSLVFPSGGGKIIPER